MSTDETLDDHERAVLDYDPQSNGHDTETEADDGVHDTETEADDEDASNHTAAMRAVTTSHSRRTHDVISQLKEAHSQLKEDHFETRRQLAEERKQKRDFAKKLNQLQDAIEGDMKMVGGTTLEKFASMDEDDRQNVISTSERRAVEIHEHWDDLAWRVNDKELIETQARANAKNNPSQAKYRLEQHFDTDLKWNEIYRMMKMVAKLSGGEETQNDYGQLRITGGDYEYYVQDKVDASGTRKVLKKVGR